MKNKCETCGPTEEQLCDDHFMERVDAQVNLSDTIEALARALSPEKRDIFLSWPRRRQEWLAVQAWTDGIIQFGQGVSPRINDEISKSVRNIGSIH